MLKHSSKQYSNQTKAIFLIFFSTFLGACFATILKTLFNELNVVTIGFFRFFLGLLIILPLIIRNNFQVLKTTNLKLYVFRSTLNIVGMLMNFTALGLMNLEKNTALSFLAPLFATILAIIILKERIRLYRTLALIIGFIGVVIIIQPGIGSFEKGIIFALIGNLSFALTIILIKKASQKDSSLTILCYQYIFTSLFAFILFLPFGSIPDFSQFSLLLVAASFGTLMHYCFNQAIKLADISFITPFKYLSLLWASIFGFIFFKDMPDLATWIGGSFIFSSVIIITLREKKLNKDIAKKSVENNL